MSSNQAELEAGAIAALDVYCRIMEVHIKSIAEGTPPLIQGKGAKAWAETVQQAAVGAKREVEFLRFVREKNPVSLDEL